MGKIYVGDEGIQITLDTEIALAGATVTKIRAKSPDPDAADKLWTATVAETTKVRFTTTATDNFDTTGKWKLQAYVEIGGWEGHGKSVSQIIYPLGG